MEEGQEAEFWIVGIPWFLLNFFQALDNILRLINITLVFYLGVILIPKMFDIGCLKFKMTFYKN